MLTLIQRALSSTSVARQFVQTSTSCIRTLAILACMLTLTLTASAAPPPEDKKFDFETDEVTVDVLKPDASVVEVLTANARKSLIRIRLDFIAEIVRSAEDI